MSKNDRSILINEFEEIEKLIAERNLQPGQLLTFGDGVPEIEYASKFGGIGVGVLSPDQSHYEHRGHFTIEKKRARLIDAGAHLIVHDFRHATTLIDLVCSNQMS